MQPGINFNFKRRSLCKSCFLDFVHHLYCNKNLKFTPFRKLDLLPSSGKKDRTETLAVESPGRTSLSPGLRLAQPGDSTARVSGLSVLQFFLNFKFLSEYRRWTKSKKQLLQIITHHRQNPLDFTDALYLQRL
jgi:hypothetical protein